MRTNLVHGEAVAKYRAIRFADHGKTDELESQMQSLYDELCQQDARLPRPKKHAVSKRLLARLVAEIGPPDDFQTIAQLMRYAGLNLCERQSGKWRGRTMISRRGRSEIRYVLNLMALPLIGRKKLFGDYYWKKKEDDKMPLESNLKWRRVSLLLAACRELP